MEPTLKTLEDHDLPLVTGTSNVVTFKPKASLEAAEKAPAKLSLQAPMVPKIVQKTEPLMTRGIVDKLVSLYSDIRTERREVLAKQEKMQQEHERLLETNRRQAGEKQQLVTLLLRWQNYNDELQRWADEGERHWGARLELSEAQTVAAEFRVWETEQRVADAERRAAALETKLAAAELRAANAEAKAEAAERNIAGAADIAEELLAGRWMRRWRKEEVRDRLAELMVVV